MNKKYRYMDQKINFQIFNAILILEMLDILDIYWKIIEKF